MTRKMTLAVAVLCLVAGTASAQTAGRAGGRGQRPPMTPEQQAAAAARRLAAENEPRPIEGIDSIWMEELTWMEIRDAIKDGKSTALILTGGVESNGPHLATGKHNFILKVMGDAIARKLGNALVAPIVTLEPGRPEGRVPPGSVFLSQETYRAVLTDMATSLKSMGFTNIILLGDSGGNQAGMKAVAEALDAKYAADPARFFFIPEYYDYKSVQLMIKENGIPEEIEPGASQGSDGLHEELGIDSLMALYDPETIRLAQREKAGRATINGISLLPLDKTLALAKKVVELRTKLTVDAIHKALASR